MERQVSGQRKGDFGRSSGRPGNGLGLVESELLVPGSVPAGVHACQLADTVEGGEFRRSEKRRPDQEA